MPALSFALLPTIIALHSRSHAEVALMGVVLGLVVGVAFVLWDTWYWRR